MFFRYDVCDIDFSTEAAVGIAVKPARHGKLGFVDLVSALKNDHLDSYVLSLPVSTEITDEADVLRDEGEQYALRGQNPWPGCSVLSIG
ncbi:hypothetical protein GCM10011579_032660 [Streptomyces albiflavescens]|uniref:Uncharacterized protein n=1 Tax=Streptomyces albiflavescens TaxID=1623582 RepID=A0A918D4J0_9ACTN|nr:hypothetical protein GCM10011579_032660 [Streptomyces albiflavescens]